MKAIEHSLSILVCARNEEDHLQSTLDSLVRQDLNSELIVVNNASTDQTNSIALQYTKRVFQCETKGKVPCLKVGVRNVTSSVVAIADADTIYPRDWTSTILSAFNHNSSARIVFGPSRPASTYFGRIVGTLGSCFVIPSLWAGVVCSLGFNMALTKDTLEQILSDFPPVAYSGWGIGTETLRKFGRKSVCYVPKLSVPKCMRRYEEHGMMTTTFRWVKEWCRLAMGKQLSVPESEYYDR